MSRQPQQGRSKASLERMLSAARQLMLERSSEDFTLQEVTERGNVSIGSIYLRFEGKDNLVRAVIASALSELNDAEEIMMESLLASSPTLGDFIPRYVEAYAAVLQEHAPLLRLSMERAAFDDLVRGPGEAQGQRAEERAQRAMLRYGDEFGGDTPELKATSAYHIIFATLGRKLALGYTAESAGDRDWSALKHELGVMCLAYLRAP